jgi:cytochrome P450
VPWFESLCRFFETDTEGQKEASRFKALVFEIFTLASSVKLGDFLPWLKWTTHVTGYVRHLQKVKANMDAYLQVFLDVKKNGTAMDTDRREDFVDVLMRQPSSEKGDGNLDDDAIRGVILDMLFAGTDTSANGADWALSALLRHPAVMSKLHAELDTVVGTDRIVTEADLPNLPYLQVSEYFCIIICQEIV